MFGLIPWKKKSKSTEMATRENGALSPWQQLRQEMDSLFDRFLSRWSGAWEKDGELQAFGRLHVDDQEAEIVVRAEIPGFDPNEIDVSLSGNCLHIKAEHKHEKKDKDNYEQSSSQYYQRVALPSGMDENNIEAKYHNGVLELHIPKTEEARPKRIEIRS